MAYLAAPMHMKRKDVGDLGWWPAMDSPPFLILRGSNYSYRHGMDGKIIDMMEDDEPLAHVPTATAPIVVHDKANIASGGESSEPPSRFSQPQGAAAEAPMDMEADGQQHRPCQNASFFSGFF